MKKLWTGHKIYPVMNYVNIWPPSVTLTLEVGDRLLHITHCLIIVNNCSKYLQNPFKDMKVMDRTRHIPSNRQCWPWMSKCDLVLGGRGLVVAHDTSSYYNKHLCQVISDSFDKWQSYGPDTKVWRTDMPLKLTKGPFLLLFSFVWPLILLLRNELYCSLLFCLQLDGPFLWLGRTDRPTEPITISPFFLRKGGGQKEFNDKNNYK
jgi:hypothetical protein